MAGCLLGAVTKEQFAGPHKVHLLLQFNWLMLVLLRLERVPFGEFGVVGEFTFLIVRPGMASDAKPGKPTPAAVFQFPCVPRRNGLCFQVRGMQR